MMFWSGLCHGLASSQNDNKLHKECMQLVICGTHTAKPKKNRDTELISHKDDVQEHRETEQAVSLAEPAWHSLSRTLQLKSRESQS